MTPKITGEKLTRMNDYLEGITRFLGDESGAFDLAIGLVTAVHHPEWALAIATLVMEAGDSPGTLADLLVSRVPIARHPVADDV